MKNLIYISTLVVLLSACRGNSFMKQRYTNFAHHNHKATGKEKTITSDEPQLTIKQPENLTKVENNIVTASAGNELVKDNLIAAEPVSIRFNANATPLYNKAPESIDQNNVVTKEKKVIKHKNLFAYRIIGTLLKIILWIIILAVVVGVIVIIGALA